MRTWIREHTLAALTLLGLAFYGLARRTYSAFYGAFGLEPEDAGVDYSTTLVRAAPGFVLLLVVLGLFFAFALAVLAAAEWVKKRLQGATDPPKVDRNLFAGAIASVIAIYVVVDLPETAGQLAERVKRGEEIRPGAGELLDSVVDNPFAIRAERVRVWPSEPGTRLPAGLSAARVVTYLGRSNDTVALWDSSQGGRVLRVPAALVVLSKPETDR